MKNQLRKIILQRRDNLKPEERLSLSKQIWTSLFTLPEFLKAKHIMIYLNFGSEVETIPFIDDLFSQNKNVYAPVTNTKNKSLTIYPIIKDKTKLFKGSYGIPEPEKVNGPINPSQIDLIIVPGVVFDFDCQRIGYGTGYYDRFLQSVSPSATILGIAYDLQLVKKIKTDKHDLPMDLVVTEKRIINRKNKS